MTDSRPRSSISRVNGFGISVSALDMLFCALGAIMLIFALQERAQIESLDDPVQQERTTAVKRRTEVLEEANSSQVTNWPGVQALPALSGHVVFVLDLSGSLSNDAQQRAQRHLITQYVLQNKIADFAVIHFADSAISSIVFGPWNVNSLPPQLRVQYSTIIDSSVRNRASKRISRIKKAGLPLAEIERLQKADIHIKLAWLEMLAERNLTKSIVGSGTYIGKALQQAVELAESIGEVPKIVLISDGQASDARYFDNPSSLQQFFSNRIAISLVNPIGGGFAKGVEKMERFASGRGNHIVISGYGIIVAPPEPSIFESEKEATPDWPLQGGVVAP